MGKMLSSTSWQFTIGDIITSYCRSRHKTCVKYLERNKLQCNGNVSSFVALFSLIWSLTLVNMTYISNLFFTTMTLFKWFGNWKYVENIIAKQEPNFSNSRSKEVDVLCGQYDKIRHKSLPWTFNVYVKLGFIGDRKNITFWKRAMCRMLFIWISDDSPPTKLPR